MAREATARTFNIMESKPQFRIPGAVLVPGAARISGLVALRLGDVSQLIR
jgi:hypothetical protein